MAEARKFKTKQAWIDGSQLSYRIAKREGWFAEASAHMPKHDARHLIGREVSAEARLKMSAAKLGIPQSQAARDAKSAAIKAWWAARPRPPKPEEPHLTQSQAQTGIKHKQHTNALPPEERRARRLITYKRSYQNRRESELARLKLKNDAERLQQWQAELAAKGLPSDTPLPSRISPLATLSPEQRIERKRARERLNHALRKARAAGNAAEVDRLEAERRKLDERANQIVAALLEDGR